MNMNLVGQSNCSKYPAPQNKVGEEIVYSMIERHSGKASQPITTRSSTTSSLILDYLKETLVLLGSLLYIGGEKMNWDLEEFYKFVDIDNIYPHSLNRKIFRANLLAKKSVDKWNEYINSDFEIPSIEFEEIEFEIETYLEASLQNMHSTADVLAQIVNIAVLSGYFKEECVSANKVKNQLRCTNCAKGVCDSFELLLKSESFKYINAFVNTIKHRRLIELIPYGEFIKEKQGILGIMFSNFKYGKEYEKTPTEKVINTYFKEIEQHIDEVGYEINKYLREKTSKVF